MTMVQAPCVGSGLLRLADIYMVRWRGTPGQDRRPHNPAWSTQRMGEHTRCVSAGLWSSACPRRGAGPAHAATPCGPYGLLGASQWRVLPSRCFVPVDSPPRVSGAAWGVTAPSPRPWVGLDITLTLAWRPFLLFFLIMIMWEVSEPHANLNLPIGDASVSLA